MMMKLAGGAGSVHPLDFSSRKRPVPRWVWLAVGASLLVHGAAGVWLYQQRFELRAAVAAPEPPTTIIELMRPPPPEPEIAQTPPPPTAIHRPAPSQVQPAEILPLPPLDTPSISDFSPIVIAPHPGPAVEAQPEPAPASGPPAITNPRWIARPTPDQMARAYPDRALRDGTEGSATLQCIVTARGSLTGCSVMSETPAGHGFGRAAMQLSRHFRLSPRTVDGQAVEGAAVTIPLTFQLN